MIGQRAGVNRLSLPIAPPEGRSPGRYRSRGNPPRSPEAEARPRVGLHGITRTKRRDQQHAAGVGSGARKPRGIGDEPRQQEHDPGNEDTAPSSTARPGPRAVEASPAPEAGRRSPGPVPAGCRRTAVRIDSPMVARRRSRADLDSNRYNSNSRDADEEQ